MEGWVNPEPGCKEQLAHGCYATVCGLRDSNPDLAIVSRRFVCPEQALKTLITETEFASWYLHKVDRAPFWKYSNLIFFFAQAWT